MKLSINEIINATHGQCINAAEVDKEIFEITTDSRSEVANGLFIPLKGEKFDAHDFIQGVFDKGVIATLTSEDLVRDNRLCTIKVENTSKAILDIARYYRSKFEIPVIGITGSVGKTSTKEMISAVLSGRFNVHKTAGNFNNEIGLPLTLFKLSDEHEAAVIEMGMNHFDEIHRLSLTALPQISVITNVGTSHIENLGSREGILKAKLEILDGMKKDGVLIINGDNDLLGQDLKLDIKKITYGLANTNKYYAENIEYKGEITTAIVNSPIRKYNIEINSLGEHMVYNTLAAIAVAEELGLSEEEILRGLKNYTPVKMRMHIETYENGITVIDDTYNASPDSMEAALKVLKSYDSKGRKIAVLGDMLEMGEFGPSLHERVGKYASDIGIDALYAIGDISKNIYKGAKNDNKINASYYTTKDMFVNEIEECIRPGDVVLFKASRGMHFEEMLAAVGKVK